MSARLTWSIRLVGAALAVAPLSPAAAVEPGRPLARYTIVESTGAPLGQVLRSSGAEATIGIRGAGDVGLFEVSADRVVSGTGLVSFESTDCSGPAFFSAPLNLGLVRMFALAGVAGQPDRLVLESGPQVSFVPRSRWNPFPPDPHCETIANTNAFPGFPAALLLDLATISFPLTATGPGTGTPGTGRTGRLVLELVDATGQVVGPLYPHILPYDGVVLIRAGGRAGLASVARDRFLSGIGYSPAYESVDCSGPALLVEPDPPPTVPTLLQPTGLLPDGTLVVATGSAGLRTIASAWSGSCLTVALGPVSVREAELFYDLRQHPAPLRPR